MLIASAVNISAANPTVDVRDIIDETQPDAKNITASNGLNKKLQKYIIKFGNRGAYMVMSHSSHRSHSSHQSHSSHRSSSGGYYSSSPSSSTTSTSSTPKPATTTAPKSPTTSSSSAKPNTTTTSATAPKSPTAASSSKPAATTPVDNGNYIFNYGQRTLKLNCIGTDVKVLTSLLLKHGFLAKGDIKTNDAGYAIFNAAVMEGIKKFQKAASLPVTGPQSVWLLRPV